MRQLHCDFQRRHPPRRLGWALLALAILGLGTVIAVHQFLLHETNGQLARIRQAESSIPGLSTAAKTPSIEPGTNEAAVAAARRAIDQLNLPWNDLFSALEATDNEDVALLFVKPDVRKGEVRIFAEARNLAAMLAYHRRLEASGQLRSVALIDHEIAAQDPLHPVRFNIIAAWGIARARP